MALEVRNKLGIVDGTVKVPAVTDPLYTSWRMCDIMARSWILKAVNPSIAQSVLHVDRAKDLWNELKRRFSHGDPHRISALHDEIANLKQGAFTVTDYYTNCRTLWDELDTLRPLPVCLL